MLTAQQFQEKHKRRLQAALEDITTGVNAVTVAPGVTAAKKADKMKANLIKSIDNGTWAKRVSSVTLEDWKNKMINVGVPRVSSGIEAASQKVQDFASQLLPAIAAAQQKIANMPDLTLEQNLNRMTAFVREMSNFRKK